jgi:hypothetical protein
MNTYDVTAKEIIGLARGLRDLQQQVAQFVGRVSGFSRNPTVLGRQLPTRLLDFCGHEPVLQLYKKLCRHYWAIDSATTADYINAYREYWGSDVQEGQA